MSDRREPGPGGGRARGRGRRRRRRIRPERPDGHPRPGRLAGRSARSWPIRRRQPLGSGGPAGRRGPGRLPALDRRHAAAACGPAGRGSAGRPRLLVAAAAAVVGYGSHGLGAPPARSGPRPGRRVRARGARRSPRSSTAATSCGSASGLLLLARAAILVRTALGGTPEPLEQLVTAGLIAGARRRGRGARRRRPGRTGDRLRARRGPSPRRAGADAADAHPIDRADEPRRLPRRHPRRSPALALATRPRASLSTAIGLAGLLVAAVAALAIDPTELVTIGRPASRPPPTLRLFLVLGSLVGLGLALVGPGGRDAARRADGDARRRSGVAGLALTLTDPRVAVLAATAGGLLGVWLTLAPGRGPGRRDASGSASCGRSSWPARWPSPRRPGSAAT